jgi:hypothetical protein
MIWLFCSSWNREEKAWPETNRLSGALEDAMPSRGMDLYGASCNYPSATVPRRDGGANMTASVPLQYDAPLVTSLGGLNMSGRSSGGTNLSGAFDMTEPGQEYMAAYNPTGLASVMPAGWRKDANEKCAGAEGGQNYAEFSRYAISPTAVAKSENLRAVMRFSENSRNNNGRTLGYTSLLRNTVTPISPQPIGDTAMLWNDSSTRQSYIAAATGKFPDLGAC